MSSSSASLAKHVNSLEEERRRKKKRLPLKVVKVLVNCCRSGMDSVGEGLSRKFGGVRPRHSRGAGSVNRERHPVIDDFHRSSFIVELFHPPTIWNCCPPRKKKKKKKTPYFEWYYPECVSNAMSDEP